MSLPSYAVVWDDALGDWLRSFGIYALDRWGERSFVWDVSARAPLARALAKGPAVVPHLLELNLRLVDVLPSCPVVAVAARDGDGQTGDQADVPVLPIVAVLDAHPQYAAVVRALLADVSGVS